MFRNYGPEHPSRQWHRQFQGCENVEEVDIVRRHGKGKVVCDQLLGRPSDATVDGNEFSD